LWLWVVLFVPVVITVLVNLLFGQSVELLTQRTVRKVLSEMEAALLADAAATSGSLAGAGGRRCSRKQPPGRHKIASRP
jgi:hypothetical protein